MGAPRASAALWTFWGENARDEAQAAQSVEAYLSCARAVEENGLDASISVKLTDLGALFDRKHCQENLWTLAKQAARCGVGFEIDIEGRPLVDFTVKAAIHCAAEGHLKLALAAERSFSLATHDPTVIGWALQHVPTAEGLLEFCFLKGLSDETSSAAQKNNLVQKDREAGRSLPSQNLDRGQRSDPTFLHRRRHCLREFL